MLPFIINITASFWALAGSNTEYSPSINVYSHCVSIRIDSLRFIFSTASVPGKIASKNVNSSRLTLLKSYYCSSFCFGVARFQQNLNEPGNSTLGWSKTILFEDITLINVC